MHTGKRRAGVPVLDPRDRQGADAHSLRRLMAGTGPSLPTDGASGPHSVSSAPCPSKGAFVVRGAAAVRHSLMHAGLKLSTTHSLQQVTSRRGAGSAICAHSGREAAGQRTIPQCGSVFIA